MKVLEETRAPKDVKTGKKEKKAKEDRRVSGKSGSETGARSSPLKTAESAPATPVKMGRVRSRSLDELIVKNSASSPSPGAYLLCFFFLTVSRCN